MAPCPPGQFHSGPATADCPGVEEAEGRRAGICPKSLAVGTNRLVPPAAGLPSNGVSPANAMAARNSTLCRFQCNDATRIQRLQRITVSRGPGQSRRSRSRRLRVTLSTLRNPIRGQLARGQPGGGCELKGVLLICFNNTGASALMRQTAAELGRVVHAQCHAPCSGRPAPACSAISGRPP